MAKHLLTSDWTNNALQIIKKFFGDECRISQSTYCAHTIKKHDISDVSVVIVFDTTYKCFVAFNGKIQSVLHQSKSDSIRITIKRTYIRKNISKITCDEIIPVYVRHNANSVLLKGCYEKIVLFREDGLAEFCENYEDYLFPNEKDENYQSPVVFCGETSIEFYNETLPVVKTNDLTERQKDIVFHPRRTPDFRRKVLDYYNRTCVVCGCKEPTILEAAHIKAVKDGGSDDVNNGICLCRNHHKLFDSGKLRIDFIKQQFSLSVTVEIDAAWYKEAIKRNCTMILPIENNEENTK